MFREKTPFGTIQLWEAFQASNTIMTVVKPEVLVTMARVIEAVTPEITLTPHQIVMAFNHEVGPRIREEYPDLFTATSAAEAVEKLGKTITLHATREAEGQHWQQGDPRLDIP